MAKNESVPRRPISDNGSQVAALIGGNLADVDLDIPAAARANVLARAEQSDPTSEIREILSDDEVVVDVLEDPKILSIDEAMGKDWSTVLEADLPPLPAGFQFEWVRETDRYRRRIVQDQPTSPAYDLRDEFRDALYVDRHAMSQGIYSEMEFRWESPKSNEVSYREADQAGYVPVTEHIDKNYKFESGRIVNGDLVLMMCPKQVIERRLERANRANQNAMGQPLRDYMDNPEPGTETEIDKVTLTQGLRGQNLLGGEGKRTVDRAQQLTAELNDQRARSAVGKKTFAINAPFQRTVVGGRTIA